jgi:hypothetical protein
MIQLDEVKRLGATKEQLIKDPLIDSLIKRGISVDIDIDNWEIVLSCSKFYASFRSIYSLRSFMNINASVVNDIMLSENQAGLFFILDEDLGQGINGNLSVAGFSYDSLIKHGKRPNEAARSGDADFVMYSLDSSDIEDLAAYMGSPVLSAISQEEYDEMGDEGIDYFVDLLEGRLDE